MASAELQQLIQMFRSRPVPERPPTLAEQRAGMEAMVAIAPLPDDVTTEPVDAGGVASEWVTAPGADATRALLYLHGGGYVIGSIKTHRELAARLSRAAGVRVLVVDYRLAPEHPFPAAIDDAVTAYRWLLAQGLTPQHIAIGGDSAGGGLTVAALLALREQGGPLPAAAVCLSPWVDLAMEGESMTSRAAADPMVQKPGVAAMAAHYLNGADPRTPLASPLYADLSDLPPMLVQVGTAETLYDDSTRLVDRARAAGVEVILEPWEDMIHVFQLFPMLPEAREASDRIGRYLAARLARG